MAGQDFTVSIIGNVTGFDVAPINNLNNALKQIPSATSPAVNSGQQLGNTFNQTGSAAGSLNAPLNTVSTSSKTLGTTFGQTASQAGALNAPLTNVKTQTLATGQSFTTATTNARGLQSSLAPLGSGMGQVTTATGTTGKTLDQLVGSLQTTGTQSKSTEGTTISLGEKIGLVGGFVTSTVSTLIGLVTGLTDVEGAQIAASRAHDRANTALLTVAKAQDTYSKMVAKFGPDSRQAQEALANLTNKQNNLQTAQERAELTQKRATEAVISYGLGVIDAVGQIAQFGATLSILVGKLGLKTLATTADTDADIANFLAAKQMEIGLTEEEIAAQSAAGGIGEADAATTGLNLRLLAIAAPLVAAAALFILIETNTFKMGDAFRSILPAIATGIDGIVNGFNTLRNAFVQLANGIESFKAIVNNIFVDIQRTIESAFNTVVVAARSTVNSITTAFAAIYNFIVDNVANPIIRSWDEMLKTVGSAVAGAVGPITGAWNSVVKGIVDIVVNAVKSINGFLQLIHIPAIDMKPLTDLQEHIKNTGSVSAELEAAFQKAFKPQPEIGRINTGVVNLNTGLIALTGQYQNVTAAGHTYDAELATTNSKVGESITKTIDFYSRQENLGKVITANVVPAFKNAFGAVAQWTGGLLAALAPQNSDAEAKNKITGATVNLNKAHKDLSTSLQDSISKILLETQAEANQVISQQFVTKALADTAKALTDATAKTQTLTTELTNGTAQWNRYNAAVAEGTNKFLELIIKAQDAGVAQKQYNALLEQATGNFNLFNGALEKTPKNMELVAKAAAGDTDAMKELQDEVNKLFDDFNKLGDSVASDLGKAMEKGSKDFKKALKDLSKQTGIDFDLMKHDMSFKTAAGMSEAKDILQKDLGAMNLLIRGNSANIGDATEQMIGKLTSVIEKSGGEITPQWQKIFDDMRKIASAPMDAAGVANALGDIRTQLDAMGIKGPQVDQIIGQISGSLNGVGTAAGTATGAIDPFNASLQQAGQLGTVWQATLQNITVAFNTGFIKAVGDAAGQLIILEQDAANVFTNISNALVVVAQNFNSAFVQAVAAANGSLVVLEQGAADAFTNITNALVLVAQNFNSAFTQGVGAATAALSTLVSTADTDFAAIITAVGNVGLSFQTAFNAGVNAAATAMNNLVTNANGNFAAITADINAVAATLVKQFGAATSAAGQSLNALTTNANGNTGAWIKDFNAAATALTNDFSTGARNAATSMNGLTTNVNGNVNAINSKLNQVVSMFNNIRGSINNAISAVNSLISRINAIPTQRTVTVTINEIHNITTIQHIIPVFGRTVPISTDIATTVIGGGTTPTNSGATTTTLAPATTPANRARVIRVEISEPTVVKLNDRELMKQINKKILELDIGALT